MDPLVHSLRHNCSLHGYGRKKWWADQLGIPPMTLSHWLAGRQSPSGKHALTIKNTLDQIERDKKLQVWKEYLWDSYYSAQPVPLKILPVIILEVLTISTLDSRTLALLSRLVEKARPQFEIPSTPGLKNRLGWLLDISGRTPDFSPDRSARPQMILGLSLKSKQLRQYLRRYQTHWGKKWRIHDCPLDKIKSSLP